MDENKQTEQTYTYGQPQEQTEQTAEQTYTYGQPYGQPYGQAYGQPNYGMGAMPLDKNGQPIKNNSTMKYIFSILEILSCCGCGLIACVMGICGCVFTNKADGAFKEGRWADYQAAAKKATIFLWVGVGAMILSIILNVLLWTVGGLGAAFMEGFESGYNSVYEDDYIYEDDYDYEEDDYSYEEDDFDYEEEVALGDDVEVGTVEVVPGEGFTDPTITVNGATVTFPLTYPELVEAGFYIDAEDEEYVINKNEYSETTLYTSDGTDIGYVYIGNETDGPLAMKDCVVFGFAITSYSLSYGDVTFSLPNGLNQNATAEDFIEAFGEPDDEYISDSYDHQEYTWYNHSDLYYDASENSISVDFWDGALDELDMRYIGWE